jgi:glycerol-3-phosphate dehydrogenase (NAD(P)+)
MTRVVILGAGVMGTALATPLSDNGHDVRLVGTHLDDEIILSCRQRRWHPKLRQEIPAGVHPFFIGELAEAMAEVEVILLGVNSLGIHWAAHTLSPYLRPGLPILAVTKGLKEGADGTLRTLPDVFLDDLPPELQGCVSYSAIGGPSIAREVSARRHTCVVFAGRDPSQLTYLADLFRTSYYHIWTTIDLVGVEVCAAMKNAYTAGVALTNGMLELLGGPDASGAAMYNTAAALFGQATFEIFQWVQRMGGSTVNAYSLPGAGDLFVTFFGGRSTRFGTLLGKGLSVEEAVQAMAGETLESLEAIRVAGRVLEKWTAQGMASPEDFPLLRYLYRLVVKGEQGEIPFTTFRYPLP